MEISGLYVNVIPYITKDYLPTGNIKKSRKPSLGCRESESSGLDVRRI